MLGRDARQTKINLAYLRPAEIFVQKKNGKNPFQMSDLYPEPTTTFCRALQIFCILISIRYNDCISVAIQPLFLYLVPLTAFCFHNFNYSFSFVTKINVHYF